MTNITNEVYISVDIEADGPIPGDYSMISFGACVVGSEGWHEEFYIELRYMTDQFVPEAMAVSGFDRAYLRNCLPAAEATRQIVGWLDDVQEMYPRKRLVMVGFNAPFDWMFVNYYLHHFIGRNPLGISALDSKSLYMGATGCTWGETSMAKLPPEIKPETGLTHNALQDARDQAIIFNRIIALGHNR